MDYTVKRFKELGKICKRVMFSLQPRPKANSLLTYLIVESKLAATFRTLQQYTQNIYQFQ